MSQANEIVYVVKTAITRAELQEVVDLLNKKELGPENGFGDEDDQPLMTIEEVLGNPELLAYLCDSLVMQDDVHEIWNSDGFCDFAERRK